MIIKIISLIFTTLYDTVLQNVRNYFGSGSMDARRNFCKWGQVKINFNVKQKEAPPPPLEKIAPKKEKKCLSHG